MTAIEGRTTLLAFIDEQKKIQGLSDAELCRRAGIGGNVLGNIRGERGSYPHMKTMLALVNALGFGVVPVPDTSLPARVDPVLVKRAPELRRMLVDLRTSIANARHPDDLRNEVDDMIYWLGAQV